MKVRVFVELFGTCEYEAEIPDDTPMTGEAIYDAMYEPKSKWIYIADDAETDEMYAIYTLKEDGTPESDAI